MSSIGKTDFSVCTKRAPAIWFVISKQMPTGGVTRPIHRLKLIMIPNCKGSMPNASSRGSRIGVIMIIAAFASISIPITRNRIFSSSRMTTVLLVKELNTSRT